MECLAGIVSRSCARFGSPDWPDLRSLTWAFLHFASGDLELYQRCRADRGARNNSVVDEGTGGTTLHQNPPPQPMVEQSPRLPDPVLVHGVHAPVQVTVVVYDREYCENVNNLLWLFGTGLYHVGVEVQGVEWIFSPVPDARGRGVHQLPLRDKRPRKLVPLGRSVLNAEEVAIVLDQLASQWQACHYHLFERNCGHFAMEVCQRLQVGPFPTWATCLAKHLAPLATCKRLAAMLKAKQAEEQDEVLEWDVDYFEIVD
mmetsp:Transcript_1962/g.4071  ORF Transcript_1962/g.4071 Transcript_1962/m.4071 type:complete len:258 (+) Transcript_1962:31-804(+)